MERIVNVGIIGCGGIAGGKHMPSLKKLSNVRMVAFCDIIREKAEKAAKTAKADKADKAEALANEWKEMMKQLKEDKNMDAISKINNLIKEKKIDVKKIEMQTVEDLTELVDFTKLQLA